MNSDSSVGLVEAARNEAALQPNNISELRACLSKIEHLESDEALALQVEISSRITALMRLRTPKDARKILGEIFGRHGVTTPDARPLHRYRISDDEYADLRHVLRNLLQSGRLGMADQHASAVFVLYCAEWFRRECASTFMRWNDMAPEVLEKLPYARKVDLAETGLRYWRRELRMNSSNQREFLLTIALEGGIPIKILREGSTSWLQKYLSTIMQRCLAIHDVDPTRITDIAEEEQVTLRKSYRTPEFKELCAELISGLVDLRKEVETFAEEAGGLDIDPVALLDQDKPDWRQQLPLYLPEKENETANALLAGLLRERRSATKMSGQFADRLLVWENGFWNTALRMNFIGDVDGTNFGLEGREKGRVRLSPAGALSDHADGDLAMLEPPAEPRGTWSMRSLQRSSLELPGFSFRQNAEVSAKQNGEVFSHFTWPSGQARWSDVLVFEEDGGADGTKRYLRLVGTGSTKKSVPKLHVAVPANWTFKRSNSEIGGYDIVASFGWVLVSIESPTTFTDPETCDVFRVEPNAKPHKRELQITGQRAAGLVVSDGEIPVYCGLPNIKISDDNVTRSAQDRELFWRDSARQQRDLNTDRSGIGLIDILWKDIESGIQIDRQRIVVLPEACRIDGFVTDQSTATLKWEGLPGWTVDPVNTAGRHIELKHDSLVITFQAHDRLVQGLRLTQADGQSFEIDVALKPRQAILVLSDGQPVAPGHTLALDQLKAARLLSGGGITLFVNMPLGAEFKPSFTLQGDTSLAMQRTRSLASEMLALDPVRECEIRLTSNEHGNRPPWKLKRYALDKISGREGRLWHNALPQYSIPVVRMLHDPRHEYALHGPHQGPWELPDNVSGTLLVYLRREGQVITKPRLWKARANAAAFACELARGTSLHDQQAREEGLLKVMDQIINAPDANRKEISWLLETIDALGGLPASALDVLTLLSRKPDLLTLLLFHAGTDDRRQAVWNLQSELPFLWLNLPNQSWNRASESRYSIITNDLKKVFDQSAGASNALDIHSMALEDLTKIKVQLSMVEPAMHSVLTRCQIPGGEHFNSGNMSLRDCVRSHVSSYNAAHSSDESGSDAIHIERMLGGGLMPEEYRDVQKRHYPVLLAPALLAANACGLLTTELDVHSRWLIRKAMYDAPEFVSAAFPKLVERYLSNQT